jgi:hypothetical protein
LNISSAYINITAKNVITDANIDNFSITINNLNRTQLLNVETNESFILENLIRGDYYNITIDAENYALSSNSEIFYANESLKALEFSLYTTNSLYISIYNESKSLIAQNVNVEIIGNYLSYNYSTSTGKKYIDLISPDEYTLRFKSTGFIDGFFFIQLSNRSYNKLDIYLLKNDTNDEITAKVYNNYDKLVNGAIIKTLKYDSDTSSYILISSVETNFEGEAKLYLKKNSEFYKFMIYTDDILRYESQRTYIYNDEIIFRIRETDIDATDYYNLYNIEFNHYVENEQFKLMFSTDDGLDADICSKLYSKYLNLDEVLINSTCLSSSSGYIHMPIGAVNGTTYTNRIYFDNDGEDVLLSELSEYYDKTISQSNQKLWLFGILLLTLVFILIAPYSLKISFLMSPLPLLMGSLLHIIPIDIKIMIGIEIVAIILMFLVEK